MVSGPSDLVEVFYVAEKFWLIVRLAGALLFWSSSCSSQEWCGMSFDY
jgi:hypothetical protein